MKVRIQMKAHPVKEVWAEDGARFELQWDCF
jgi:hypothetical protein